MILDLGCGDKKIPDSIGVDLYNKQKADVIANIKIGLPFKDNTFDVVNCSHILEHFSDLIPIMEDIYRITKKEGKVLIEMPHYTSPNAWGNPTHYRCFNSTSFNYFDNDQKEHYGKCDFKVKSVKLLYNDEKGKGLRRIVQNLFNFLANKNIPFCEWVWANMVGGFALLKFELEVIK